MIRKTVVLAAVLAAAMGHFVRPIQTQSGSSKSIVLYEGARLIPGDGGPPIVNAAMLVENGVIIRVGAKGRVNAPRAASRVDLTGKTIMPTLINAHGHPGFQRGLSYGADNFTRETIMEDLNRALYFGVAAVQSQGIEKGEVTYQVRRDQEAGKLGGARLHIAGRSLRRNRV
jgi:imidazolonepropionase-like amidohydrolase